MTISKRARLRLPIAVRQGLTLLSGSTVAQIVPAIAAPVVTRLYHPVDFGMFAFVLAVFGVLAPVVCMRYGLAILLPEDEEYAAHVTLLCLILAFTIAVLSLVVPACLLVFASAARTRTFAIAAARHVAGGSHHVGHSAGSAELESAYSQLPSSVSRAGRPGARDDRQSGSCSVR